jgi:Zn-dependent protease
MGPNIPEGQYDVKFTLLGIPVRVHPLFWLVTAMLGLNREDAAGMLTWVVAVFFAILFHEFGHAAVVRAYGLQPWITLYGMGGLTSYDPDRSYRSKAADPLGQILISLAGPAAGFLLAAVLAGGILLAGRAGYHARLFLVSPFGLRPYVVGLASLRVSDFLNDLFYICTVWGLVNLLPIYPLDGGQVAREIFLKLYGRQGIRLSLILSMLVAGMLAVYAGVKWPDRNGLFVAILFGSFAYWNYATLKAYTDRG